jgi:excisionase family DNA binding protein
MGRFRQIPADDDPTPDVQIVGHPGEILPLIRGIYSALDDIRTQLGGLRKSHYTVEEVAEATGRAAYTVRAWIKQGRIRAIRVPDTGPKGRLLIPREEFEKLVGSGLAGQAAAVLVD